MAIPAGSGAPAPPKPVKPPKGGKAGKPNKNLAKAAAGPVPGSPAYQAQQEIDPIIAAIRAAAQGEAASADKAIEGLTNSYAKGIAGIDYGAPYSSAEAQQAAVDNALRQSSTGQGSDLAAALSQRLQALQGSSGAGAVNQEAAALTNQGAGIGNAQLAGGSAELGQLIADAAAAKGYGQKMPGVIRSAGLQGISQAQGQAQQAINQGTLQAEGQLPSIIQTIKADRQAAQQAKVDQAYKQAEMAYKQASLNSTNAYRQAEVKLRQASLAQGQQRIQIMAQRAAQTAYHENQTTKEAWARIGIAQKNLQLRVLENSAKAKMGGLSPAESSRYKALADSWAQRMMGSSTNPTTGKHEPQLSFKDAMTNALKSGVPLSIAFPQFIKVAKQAGATPAQIRALQKEYAPLDKALTAGIQKAGRGGSPLGFGTSLGIAGGNAFKGAGGAVAQAGANAIVRLAKEYKGTPYVWGGESPKGFDCSGFAQFIYGKVGINIPRTTYTQWQAKNGHAVSKRNLAPGDLVFFRGSDSIGGLPGHVGIYIGNGLMIDAPHTGADVRIESVANFGGYMGARRFSK